MGGGEGVGREGVRKPVGQQLSYSPPTTKYDFEMAGEEGCYFIFSHILPIHPSSGKILHSLLRPFLFRCGPKIKQTYQCFLKVFY